jgi:hypothetical protein
MRNESFVTEVNYGYQSRVVAKRIRVPKGLRSSLDANLSGISIGEA